MQPVNEEKKALLSSWIAAHSDGNVVKLFSTLYPSFEITKEAESFLFNKNTQGMYLYILCTGTFPNELSPIYIGKTSSPAERWIQGHLRELKVTAKKANAGLYSRWIERLKTVSSEIYLFCIHEHQIKSPPIPFFPKTIGSIEYQLISLATDCLLGQLLNFEGVAR